MIIREEGYGEGEKKENKNKKKTPKKTRGCPPRLRTPEGLGIEPAAVPVLRLGSSSSSGSR